jgi:hypothetical protein
MQAVLHEMVHSQETASIGRSYSSFWTIDSGPVIIFLSKRSIRWHWSDSVICGYTSSTMGPTVWMTWIGMYGYLMSVDGSTQLAELSHIYWPFILFHSYQIIRKGVDDLFSVTEANCVLPPLDDNPSRQASVGSTMMYGFYLCR